MTALTESDGGIVACWSCRGPVTALALFCHTCGAVQPPRQVDHFARLGLARGFEVDLAELDRRYFVRSYACLSQQEFLGHGGAPHFGEAAEAVFELIHNSSVWSRFQKP